MSDTDNDEPTVVIDFNSLKDELQGDEILTDDPSFLFGQELEIIEEDDSSPDLGVNLEEEIKKNIYFFEYKSQYFQKRFPANTLDNHMKLISTLKDLNQALTADPESIIIFYYNDSPKEVNQLSKQIRRKFTKTKTMIIARNLSANKAQAHAQSKYGADTYLSDPFEIVQFYQCIKQIS